MLSQYLPTIQSLASEELIASDFKLFRIEESCNTQKRHMGKFNVLLIRKHDRHVPITIAGSDLGNEEISILIQGIIRAINMFNLLGIYRNRGKK